MPQQPNEPSQFRDTWSESQSSRKRPGQPATDSRYPRKRSSKACHVCRARKTKCDNVRPTCGFCTSIGISCSYDDTERDHSTFDPASLEILRQLSQVLDSQDNILHIVRSVAAAQSQHVTPGLLQAASNELSVHPLDDALITHDAQREHMFTDYSWFAQQSDSPSTPRGASTSVAAVRWFGLLANDAPRETLEDVSGQTGEGIFLGSPNGQSEDEVTPLQLATKAIDSQHDEVDMSGFSGDEQLWQASESIPLLHNEQLLFENFIHRICSWLDLFDTARTFSTIVPRLATRNAGLLNAIMALSCFHKSLDDDIPVDQQHSDQNSALQYYYQTLHYVQKAMRYTSYQNSLELMATTLIVSTYEMLRGSRKDCQQHLQGVFWILRSRQIEVEASSLESTTWWAWLRQDIWVAFREGRRTYSTWTPNKTCSELNSHELASRIVWILAQVVNFCAVQPADGTEGSFAARVERSKALKKMLEEWEAHLTIEFSELPTMGNKNDAVFRPRLIHPQHFGLAMQIYHVCKILIYVHEPSSGGVQDFLSRQSMMQDSIDRVCGIGMALTEDVSSMTSSQCLFMAGMFMQNPDQRRWVLEMLDSCRKKCRWPMESLAVDLKRTWETSWMD